MRVVIAPDKFKGSLSAQEVAAALAAGLTSVRPDIEPVILPMADGGEGTVDAAIAAGFEPRTTTVSGPTGQPVAATWGLRDKDAVIEMAAASGLDVLPGGKKNALGATSRGTGELIKAALDAGATNITLGVGGSASTDGGAGLLRGLGARVLNTSGEEIPEGGGHLANASELDLSGFDQRVQDVVIVLAADVDNPLTGPRGAPAVFGPQKGASERDVETLEDALTVWAGVVGRALGADAAEAARLPGAGAAGGVGYAALAVLGASRRPGVEVVAQLVGLAQEVATAAAVITGEGSLDAQSLGGKTPTGVADVGHEVGVPVWAVCGRTTLEEAQWRDAGFAGVLSLSQLEPDPQRSMSRAGQLVTQVGKELAGLLPASSESNPIKEDA